jgi:Tol biopolymer transport system component
MTKKAVLISLLLVGIIISSLSSCSTLLGLFGFGKPEAEVVVDIASFTNSQLLQGVTRITDDGLPKSSPVISPDGTKLLYCEVKPDTGASDIVLLRNVNSSAKTPLVTTGNAFTPGWYEDSTKLLYSFREGSAYRIVRSSTAGGGRTNITRNPVGGRDQRPVIKNGVILMNTWEGGGWSIYSMKENGSEVTRLVNGYDPEWHPTEPKFLYIKGSPSGIWEMDITTMQETLLYEMPPYNIRYPKYTRDGSHIVFQRGSSQMVAGTEEITVIQEFLKKTTQKDSLSTETRWQLYSITAEGANESALTEGNVDCTFPSLDIDNTLFFISNASGVNSNKTELYKARLNFDE